VRDLIDDLNSLPAGVVSVSGFATAFLNGTPLVDSLRILNFHRENLARPPLRQIWWMPASLVEEFIRAVPDLDSWFMLRLHLTEAVTPAFETETVVPQQDKAVVGVEDARKRAKELVERFETALKAGVSREEVLATFVMPALATLYEAGAEREARDLEIALNRKIGEARNTRVFISYSHDSAEHENRVWDLCERLRNDGIDCRIDQHEFSPPEGWPRWCRNQVQESQFVLVVCTQTYKRRHEGKAPAGKGKGANWEGFIITLELYEAEGRNTKFIPVVFSSQDAQHIPPELRGSTRYDLSTPEGYDNLFRHLTNQPAREKSSVAQQIRAMPPLARKQRFSGPLWNVPIPRNPFFTGRGEVLADVEKELNAGGLVALTGMGGVGKTQIAAHFAHEHRDEYSAVLWASATSQAILASDFATSARLLNLPEKDEKDQALAVAAVKRWLETDGGWLLILNNASDLATVHEFIPQAAKGHVLLTTQARATGDIQAIEVRDMLPEDGALLLLRRAKIIKPDAPLSAVAGFARDTAMHISKELGGLPLALDQAGAYIEETGCGLASYLDLYRQRRAELLKRRGGFGPPHPESVAATLALSFEEVATASPAAADLLRLCAFLYPDAIPEEIFTKGAADLGPNLSPMAAAPLKLDVVCSEILQFSLIRRDSGTLSIHRLVQQVIRDGMGDKKEERLWAERAVRAVNGAFPSPEFANWAQCERFVPQALACATLIEAYGLEFEAAARLLNQAGYYLNERARFPEAEPLFQRALAINEKALGPDHPEVAVNLNNLAELYQAQGRYAQAEPLYRRALAICEEALGPEHPSVATSLNNLAGLYYKQGKYAQAEPVYQRALAIWEKALGPDHPGVATSLNNLAVLYKDQGRYAQAERLYLRALAIDEKALGPDHPHVATDLNNLAGLYHGQGKYAEAEPLLQRALAIDEKALGPNHPGVAANLNNLAELYRGEERYAEAEPLYQRALAIREKVLGPDHPDVASTLNNLALLYEKQGRYEQAEPLYQRALAIRERALGPDHSNVATSLNNLATLYYDQGRYAQAEPLYQRALVIDEKALGPHHPRLAPDLNNLAALYYKQGKVEQAEPLCRRALAIMEKALGPQHPDVAKVLDNYARLLHEMKRGAAAGELEARAQAIRAAHAKHNPPK
jgi:tetratricopeptide (TPR) repeat protein/energy-coupling factor transporter ATP-binding protein EcfA2